MLRKRFKESSDLYKQVADDLGIETLTMLDVKKLFTDSINEFIKKDFIIEACTNNHGGEIMSCYFTKDGNSFYGIEMYKERKNACDVITISEVECSDSHFRNCSETDNIKFYYLDDNHIYNSYEDMKTVDKEAEKLI